jgi:signal transduction histidine kinase/CheY-like chemotaxis protein
MTPARASEHEQRVLVLAPFGRDGRLTCEVLHDAGIDSMRCDDIGRLCDELRAGAGAVVIAAEALHAASLPALADTLAEQPAWSDIPLILAAPASQARAAREWTLRALEPARHIMLLERPVRVQTLVSVVHSALSTRRRQYEMRDLIEELRRSHRHKDEFLAMLAHELRNPLGAIGNTVKLLERSSHEETSRRYFAILNRQTNMLRGLVDDLLDVSRITRGLIELKQERVDLAAVANRALESVQPLMDDKRHEVSAALPRNAVQVVGDPVRLEQILVNLLTNAAKYTDPGGRIALSLERRGEWAELRVRDTGIGMTPEVLERVFELFGQAERGLARSEGGLGIGLTIVQRLVELHGGQIEARSEGLNKGAEFVVSLPLAPVEEAAPALVKQEPGAPIRTKRILVVEDSKDIAETLALLLEDSGHEVVLAHDGPSALEKAEETEPELILLDIGLPGLDGYEVAARLRQNPLTQQTILVALTGYGRAEDVERARAAGFDRHFTKPVDIDALEEFVNAALPRAPYQ